MKTHAFFCPNRRAALSLGVLLLASGTCDSTFAQTSIVPGSVIVQGDLEVQGSTFNLGSWSNDSTKLGLNTTYAEDNNFAATLTFLANRPVTNWLWQQVSASGTTPVRQMLLSAGNALTLYDQATPQNSAIVLDPLVRSMFQTPVTFNGSDNQMPNQQATGANSVLTVGLADARYPVHSNGNQLTLGTGASAGADGIAFGASANASGGGSMAVGNYSSATGYDSTTLGFGAGATNSYAMALGVGTVSSGYYSTSVGTYSQASGTNSIALGVHAQAIGISSTALGDQAVASGSYSTAVGQQAVAQGDYTTVVGGYITVSGPGAAAFGGNSIASGAGSVSLGLVAGASGVAASAIGYNSAAQGDYSSSLGSFSRASGAYSTALSSSSVASGDYSTAGGNTAAGGYYQFAIGRNSVLGGDAHNWVDTDDLFTVGNGASTAAPANAFSVKKNGDTTVTGNLTVVKAFIVQPQGDLSMGEFTAKPSPTP